MLIGAVALVAFLALYAMLVLAAAIVLQVSDSKLVEIAFYPLAGLLWLPVAMVIVRWMAKA
jgi:Protein of unknown function (DUF2842)